MKISSSALACLLQRYLNSLNWPLAKLRVWHGGAESHLLHVRPRWATTRALSHAYTSTRSMAQASVVRRLSRRVGGTSELGVNAGNGLASGDEEAGEVLGEVAAL